jgi:hypothetical protein
MSDEDSTAVRAVPYKPPALFRRLYRAKIESKRRRIDTSTSTLPTSPWAPRCGSETTLRYSITNCSVRRRFWCFLGGGGGGGGAFWPDPPSKLEFLSPYSDQILRQLLKNGFVGRVLAIVGTKRNDGYRGPWLDSTSAVCY